MYRIVRREKLAQGESRTIRFEGKDHGAGVSFFLVDNDPGQGPGLHVHPYPETWIVRSGKAEFDVDGRKLPAGAGDIVVVEANVPHGFKNVGDDRLDLVCIHACDRIIQDWL